MCKPQFSFFAPNLLHQNSNKNVTQFELELLSEAEQQRNRWFHDDSMKKQFEDE